MKNENSEEDHHQINNNNNPALIAVIVSSGDTQPRVEDDVKLTTQVLVDCSSKSITTTTSSVPMIVDKAQLSRDASSKEQCRVCQQDKEEDLIDLGCKCRGGLGKAHLSCIAAWFRTKGSNKCEICQDIAANVPAPEYLPIVCILNSIHCSWADICVDMKANTWVLRIDPSFQPQDHGRGRFSPLWVAFSILIAGLLLDVLISITLGISALPINIVIGVIVVLGLGTALRLALEFCHEWRLRRAVQRVETNVTQGYHPAFLALLSLSCSM
ncbi:hypothetical protein ACFE04_005783 [Oxalis oulophora]